MSILTYQDGSFSIGKDDIIFSEKKSCKSINILLQGKVDVYLCFLDDIEDLSEIEIFRNSLKLFSIEKGSVLGCEGLFDEGRHYFTFKSAVNSAVYVFSTPTIHKIHEVLDSHKEYGAYIITSIANSITNCLDMLTKVKTLNNELSVLTDNLLNYYWYYKELLGFNTTGISQEFLDKVESYTELKDKKILPPTNFEESFFLTGHSSDNSSEDDFDFNNTSEAIYYNHFQSVPMEFRKSFYGHDFHVTSYQFRQGVLYLNELTVQLKESLKTLHNLYTLLCNKNSSSILGLYARSAYNVSKNSASGESFIRLIDFIGKKVSHYITLLKNEYGNDFGIDSESTDNIIYQAKLGINPFAEKVTEEITEVENFYDKLPEELNDSARKIIEYSGIDEDSAASLISYLESFRLLNDKFTVDAETATLRKNLSELFFKVYDGVIKRVIKENPNSRLYHMFLNFGYMDERLLTPEQTLSLYNATDSFIGSSNSGVYCMRDWLTSIYEIKKDPSMNEFSMDYNDVFRDMKKRGEITEKEKPAYMANKDGRLSFEVFNMFKTNQKVCYGQPSTYFPILHKAIFVRELDKALVTPEKVIASLERVLEIDYSAFHREINYINADKGIEKELLMLQILPDIILMPTFGSRGIMWQEITGRNRSTPGRFVIPIMTAESLDDMIVKLVGNFRWELCRTMMGVAWNDITQKSLTSEYTDYIQFYKKNKELTDDNKEKIAVQIVKHRNLMRDIFTSDYEAWFNYESKGVLRLNKIARSILYKYCPFNKQIREDLSKHPLFSEIDSRYRILRAKQTREVENHYRKLERSGIELDKEMVENLRFYKEM